MTVEANLIVIAASVCVVIFLGMLCSTPRAILRLAWRSAGCGGGSLSDQPALTEAREYASLAGGLLLIAVLIVVPAFSLALCVHWFVMPLDLALQAIGLFSFDPQVFEDRLVFVGEEHWDFMISLGVPAELVDFVQDVIWHCWILFPLLTVIATCYSFHIARKLYTTGMQDYCRGVRGRYNFNLQVGRLRL